MPISQISIAAISRDREIGRHGAEPGPPAAAHQADRQPVLEQEQIGRAEAEHHQRMAVEAIAQPRQQRQREIFAHGQRIDVADAAAVEIAGAGMMHGVGAPPEIIGRQRQHADDAADPVVGRALRKNEPCPQSCWIMNSRTRNPAAGRGEQQAIQ